MMLDLCNLPKLTRDWHGLGSGQSAEVMKPLALLVPHYAVAQFLASGGPGESEVMTSRLLTEVLRSILD